jgi:uncharacterized protein YndB with AHSA1/START domain
MVGPHGFTNPVCEMDVRPGGGVGMVAGAARMLEGMEAGWTQSIDRLAAHVARAMP